ncbi:MAG: hypothetical protein KAU31_15845 [Spirochaetaceae bacterium]|nr:hypothetical protein [Spirochaetaceae bacterium]
MQVKPSELRRRLFELMDQCLESGETIDIPRKGGTLRLTAISRRVPIALLTRRPGRVVGGDELDTFSPAEWRP